MRRFFSLLAVLVCLTAFPACTDSPNEKSISTTTAVTTTAVTTTSTTTVTTTSAKAQMTVYITKTGECYHLDGCHSLRKSKNPVTLERAIRRNYRACQLCNPPILP